MMDRAQRIRAFLNKGRDAPGGRRMYVSSGLVNPTVVSVGVITWIEVGGSMGFVLVFFASWLAAVSLFRMKKSLSPLENTWIYLVAFVAVVNMSWVFGNEWKLFEITKNPLDYTAYMIYRSICLPSLYAAVMNLIYRMPSIGAALLCTAGFAGIALGLDALLRYYGILVDRTWNGYYEIGSIVLLFLLVFFAHRLLRRILLSEVKQA